MYALIALMLGQVLTNFKKRIRFIVTRNPLALNSELNNAWWSSIFSIVQEQNLKLFWVPSLDRRLHVKYACIYALPENPSTAPHLKSQNLSRQLSASGWVGKSGFGYLCREFWPNSSFDIKFTSHDNWDPNGPFSWFLWMDWGYLKLDHL